MNLSSVKISTLEFFVEFSRSLTHHRQNVGNKICYVLNRMQKRQRNCFMSTYVSGFEQKCVFKSTSAWTVILKQQVILG